MKQDEKGRIIEWWPQDTNKNGTAGRPTVMTPETVQKLEDAFKRSYTDIEACLSAWISTSTFYSYCKENPEFKERKEELKKYPNLAAKEVWLDKIGEGDYTASKEWLERKSREEFSTKQNIDQNTTIESNITVKLPNQEDDEQ